MQCVCPGPFRNIFVAKISPAHILKSERSFHLVQELFKLSFGDIHKDRRTQFVGKKTNPVQQVFANGLSQAGVFV